MNGKVAPYIGDFIVIKSFYQCPYCRCGDGDVVIDTAAEVVWPGQHPDATDFFVSEHPEQRVVRFDARVEVSSARTLSAGPSTSSATI